MLKACPLFTKTGILVFGAGCDELISIIMACIITITISFTIITVDLLLYHMEGGVRRERWQEAAWTPCADRKDR